MVVEEDFHLLQRREILEVHDEQCGVCSLGITQWDEKLAAGSLRERHRDLVHRAPHDPGSRVPSPVVLGSFRRAELAGQAPFADRMREETIIKQAVDRMHWTGWDYLGRIGRADRWGLDDVFGGRLRTTDRSIHFRCGSFCRPLLATRWRFLSGGFVGARQKGRQQQDCGRHGEDERAVAGRRWAIHGIA